MDQMNAGADPPMVDETLSAAVTPFHRLLTRFGEPGRC